MAAKKQAGLVGKGTYGSVYPHPTKQDAVIKVANLNIDIGQRCLISEIGLLLQCLVCPFIVNILGLEREHQKIMLVLERCECTLSIYCENEWWSKGVMAPLSRIYQLLGSVVQAVAFLHNLGVAHADLKFENILVDANGVPKLCDLGMAHNPNHLKENGKKVLGITAMCWKAPEVMAGKRHDLKIDIWAIGCLMYSLVKAELLFRGQTLDQVAESILKRTNNRCVFGNLKSPDQFRDQRSKKRIEDIGKVINTVSIIEQESWLCRFIAIVNRYYDPCKFESYVTILEQCLSPNANDRPSANVLVDMIMKRGTSPTSVTSEPDDLQFFLEMDKPQNEE